jgi:glycosyltransferase involved in cell wall biosynthesis
LLIESKIVDPDKSGVIGEGSICGVDTKRFYANRKVQEDLRCDLGLPADAVVILYMARLTVDKGALAMADAYAHIGQSTKYRTHLLMVGPDEEGLTAAIKERLHAVEGKYTLVNYTDKPEYYFQGADLFCLPSYREGFPMVLLNAAASELPVVASRIYGCFDAVVDGVTGRLFEAGNIPQLCSELEKLIMSSGLRMQMGRAARTRVDQHFSEERINRQLMQIYQEEAIQQRGESARRDQVA